MFKECIRSRNCPEGILQREAIHSYKHLSTIFFLNDMIKMLDPFKHSTITLTAYYQHNTQQNHVPIFSTSMTMEFPLPMV